MSMEPSKHRICSISESKKASSLDMAVDSFCISSWNWFFPFTGERCDHWPSAIPSRSVSASPLPFQEIFQVHHTCPFFLLIREMHVGMVAFIVEGRVPSQIRAVNLHPFTEHSAF